MHRPSNTVSGLPERLAEAAPSTLLELRQLRLRELIRQYPRELDSDGSGQPVRRGVLVVLDPDQASLHMAVRAGFEHREIRPRRRARHSERDPGRPEKCFAREALKRLRKAAPRLQADFDHLYEPAGGELLPFAGALAANQGRARASHRGRRRRGRVASIA